MKRFRLTFSLILFLSGILCIPFSGCKKEDNTTINDTVHGTVTDIDGNVYKTILIGDQTWMAENLKVTRFNDGSAIPLILDSNEWNNLTTPGFCWYDNDSVVNKEEYGGLYNWYAVNTGKLAPIGWHVPSDQEWWTLFFFLGNVPVLGAKMKETGTEHWMSPNVGATNSSGFTALPGGCRIINRQFDYLGQYGYWWASTEMTLSQGWSWGLVNDSEASSWIGAYFKTGGFSIRCIQD